MSMFTKEFIIELIDREHFGRGKSIRLIERELGVGKTTVSNHCKRYGIKVKSRTQSIRDNSKFVPKQTGEDHWSAKQPERHKKNCLESSKRMKINNPLFNDETLIKTIKAKAEYMGENPTFHEAHIFNWLNKMCVVFEFQVAIDRYIADFIIGNTILEIDGRGHASRRAKDAIRDEFLGSLGFNVMRVAQDSLFDKRCTNPRWKLDKLLKVIKDNIAFAEFSHIDPPAVFSKYRVTLRDAKTGATSVF